MHSTPLELPCSGLISGVAAWAAVGVLHLGVPAVVILLCTLRAHRAASSAQIANAQGNSAGALTPGLALVHGHVEVAPGSPYALHVEITQRLHERQRRTGGWTHTWAEIHREVSTPAFWVHDPRGRVQIPAGSRPLIVEEFPPATISEADSALRMRRITVRPGDHIYVYGTLAPEPKSPSNVSPPGERTLIMQPPRRGRLLISRAPIAKYFHKEIIDSQRTRNIFLVIGLLFALLDMGAWARIIAGRVEVGTILEAKPIQAKNINACALLVELPNQQKVEVDTDIAGCRGIEVNQRAQITVVGSKWFAHIGSKPAVHEASIAISALILFFAAVGYLLRDRRSFDSKLVEIQSGKYEDTKS